MAVPDTNSLSLSLWKLVIGVLITMGKLQDMMQPKMAHQILVTDPDSGKTTPQIIVSRGFICEIHNVSTPDGYFITVFRVVNPSIRTTRGPPLIVQHGYESSAQTWFWGDGDWKGAINTPLTQVGNSAPLEFAKRGYDVWVPADRGTRESPFSYWYNYDKDLRYWDYSLDELALIDIPVLIHYIRNWTRKPKVGFYSHSQGGTRALMLLSTLPEYNQIMQPVILLAPITYLINSPNFLINPIARMVPDADGILIKRRGKFLGSNTGFLNNTCYRRIIGQVSVCGVGSISSLGPECNGNLTRNLIFDANIQAASSSWQVAQFVQFARTDQIRRLDAGPELNMKRYGTPIAPYYDLSRITNPYIVTFSSPTDDFQSPIDQARMVQAIESRGNRLFYQKLITDRNFCHNDFTHGTAVGQEVIAPTLQLLSYFP